MNTNITVHSYESNIDVFHVTFKGERIPVTIITSLNCVLRVLSPSDYDGNHHGYEFMCLEDDENQAIIDACVTYYDALGFE